MQGIAGSLDRSATRTTIAGKDILLLFVALLALNVAANYMLVGRFGMYEDDIIYLMKYLDFSVDWGRPIRKLLWDGSGRPFHAILMLIESSALSATQSAVIVYLVDAVVQTIAAILWFSVLAARVGKFTASLAAVFCLIMPLHTVGQFLCGSIAFSMAMIFTLTAVFMNRSHRNIMFALSYVVAGITLLTYEPFYLLFALAPWLHRPLQTLKIRKVGFHLASVFAIFVAFVAVRQYMDVRPMDTVTGAMTPSEIVVSVGLGALMTAANSVRFLPLFLNFTDYSKADIAIFAVAFLMVGLTIWHTFKGSGFSLRSLAFEVDVAALSVALVLAGYTLSWVVLLGATETNPLTSRESRVNVASVYGYSLLFATFVSYLSSAVAPNLQRPLFSGLAAFLIAAMIVNRVHVQYDYGRSWDITKEELRQIIDETPEATGLTTIVVSGEWHTLKRLAQGWPLLAIGDERFGWPFLIDALMTIPGKPETIPWHHALDPEMPRVLFPLQEDWPSHLRKLPDGYLTIDGTWPPIPIEIGNVVHFRLLSDRMLVRDNAPVLFEGRNIIGVNQARVPFWRRAAPTHAMQILMPDVALWLSRKYPKIAAEHVFPGVQPLADAHNQQRFQQWMK
jgi:hypothetical protein